MDNKLNVGFVQFNVTNNIDKNVSYVTKEISKISSEDAALMVLPELWSCGLNYKLIKEAAKKTENILQTITALSKKHNITIVGSLPEAAGKNIYNTAFVTGPSGKVISKYRKIHLFPPLKEDKHFAHGKKTATFTVNGIKAGLAICFDIRFPEMIRKLAAQKIQLLVVCAQWPRVRVQHWLTLLKARAIENQMFVIGVNRCGTQEGVDFPGHSLIVNPYGETIYESLDYDDTVDLLLDFSLVRRFKDQFDSFSLRRPKTYEF